MAGNGLFSLYKLHLVDAALYEMKQRAASLDVGKAELARIKEIETDPDGVLGTARALAVELKDHELQQKSLEDKIKKIDSDIYGGKIVNSKEISSLEKERGQVSEQRNKVDSRIMEIWDELPIVQEPAKAHESEIASLNQTIAKKRVAAKAEHEKLQVAYKEKAKLRPAALADVPKALLDQYEKLRAKLDVGMALVTDEHRCASCGMHIPERAFEFIIEDRVTQCENCRRILFRLQQS